MATLPRDVVVLAPEQFDKLVELLTPGYELAKAYMAQTQPADAGEPPTDGASAAGEGIPGTMDPGPQVSSDGGSTTGTANTGEANPMDTGGGTPPFRKSAAPPEFDDPSKQGSG